MCITSKHVLAQKKIIDRIAESWPLMYGGEYEFSHWLLDFGQLEQVLVD